MSIGMRSIEWALVGGVLFFLLFGVGCFSKNGTHEIGVIIGTEYFGAFGDSFIEYMGVLGFPEGELISYDIRVGEFSKEEVTQIAQEFIDKKVDVIVTVPTGTTSVAQAAVRSSAIPMVFGIAHTEGTGIINTVKRPGRNITGVRFPSEDLAVRRFEYLVDLVPDAHNIMIPHRAGHPGIKDYLAVLKERASQLGKKLVPVALTSKEDFDAFIENYPDNETVDAILQLPDPVGSRADYFELYGRYAMNKDIVVGGDYVETDEINSTFGIQVDVQSAARQVAFLVTKILEGANAGSLSVLSPDPELTVNLKELERLGIDAPDEVIYEADFVIR